MNIRSFLISEKIYLILEPRDSDDCDWKVIQSKIQMAIESLNRLDLASFHYSLNLLFV